MVNQTYAKKLFRPNNQVAMVGMSRASRNPSLKGHRCDGFHCALPIATIHATENISTGFITSIDLFFCNLFLILP